MRKNLISILISNYNKEKYIYKCLKSCRWQLYKNFEVIIHDDSSKDNSLKIIEKFKNFKLIRNKNNYKLSAPIKQINALITAFKKSNGKIICLLDSDDYFEKNKLMIINKNFEKKKINFLVNYPKINDKHFKIKKKKSYSIWPTIFPTSCISISRKSFKKFLGYLYPNKFPNLEIDARLIMYAKFVLNSINYETRKLTYYTIDPWGISSNSKKFSKIWWIKRLEAFEYLKLILKKEKKFFKTSFDYYITIFINKVIKSLNI